MNFRHQLQPRFLLIVLVLASVAAGIIIERTNFLSGSQDTIILGYCEEIVWISATMLMVFLFMHTRWCRRMTVEPRDDVAVVIGVLVFGNLATLGFLAGFFDYFTLFRFNVIIILVSGLCGGWRIAVPSAAYAVVAMTPFLHQVTWTDSWMVVLMFASAALGGFTRDNRCPKWFIWLIPIVLTVIYYMASDALVLDYTGHSGEAGVAVAASGLTTLLGCYYSIVLYDMFDGILSNRELVERNDRDLQVAHDIQMAAVPDEFPVSRSLDIYGRMESATEVGGDFYDSFLVSRNLTAFIIADVSDKGLPASMLMMRMIGSFKATAMLSNDPGYILTTVNRELCRNNPAEQFLTVWMGVYDSDTGILQYSNAGHPPPFIRRRGGEFVPLEVRKGPIIGFSDSVRYKTSQIVMQDGDSVFTYTDGVNEAFNLKGEQFGKDRVAAALNSSGESSPKVFVENVLSSVKTFTAGCPASDDVTMLAFSVNRPRHGVRTFPGKVEHLGEVNAFLEDYLTEAGCPVKQVLKTEIVAEEVFVNICDHAYVDKEGDVTVYCRYTDGEIKISFCDDADYFNPVNKEDISIDDDVGNWPVGGFGIHMVRNLVTHMDYKYFAGKNIFTVWKKVEPQE